MIRKPRKASIYVPEDLWRSFMVFVVKKHGTARKTSEEAEIAIREYLERHKSNTAFSYTAKGKKKKR